MLWPGDNLFRLFSDGDMDDVRFAAFCLDDSDLSMVAPMGHAFVRGGFDYDCDFFTGLVGSEDSAEADLSSLARFLPEKASRSRAEAL